MLYRNTFLLTAAALLTCPVVAQPVLEEIIVTADYRKATVNAIPASMMTLIVRPMRVMIKNEPTTLMGMASAMTSAVRDARMNTPGQLEGNWCWRMGSGQLEKLDWKWMKQLAQRTGRAR